MEARFVATDQLERNESEKLSETTDELKNNVEPRNGKLEGSRSAGEGANTEEERKNM